MEIVLFIAVWLGTLIVLVLGRLIIKRCPKATIQRCRHCGYDLRGNVSGFCSECGKRILGAPVGWQYYRMSTHLPWVPGHRLYTPPSTFEGRLWEYRSYLMAGCVLVTLGIGLLGVKVVVQPQSGLSDLIAFCSVFPCLTGPVLIVGTAVAAIRDKEPGPAQGPRCGNCGRKLTGMESGVCPECQAKI